ncbi:hypothetical protein DFJ63DRAFT_332857 [Scheffersomyces coipomensis]|uniref:uncharacterized protein n=1 Tax=Scheffersomyces coipomensis TaxID=1788519 RepID=UPI00315CD733
MTYQDLPSRQKSQRLINRLKSQQQQQQFQQYKQRAKNINNINELLPGLNDISDAFEALPLDLIKYFTLLKEIDAKCINSIPQINYLIKNHINGLHETKDEENEQSKQEKKSDDFKRLFLIKSKINEIIPCLEEKMHVTSVATDLLHKHMYRINNDYKLIINNNEIPESIRIGPLNHPAMIMDSSFVNSNSVNGNAADRSAQAQRSESRREALAAKKANKEDSDDHVTTKKKRNNNKEATPLDSNANGSGKHINNNSNNGNNANNSNNNNNGSGTTTTKKRSRKEPEDKQKAITPSSSAGSNPANPSNIPNNNTAANVNNGSNVNGPSNGPAKKKSKPKKEESTDIIAREGGQLTTESGHKIKVDIIAQQKTAGGSSTNVEPTYCYCNQVSFGEMVGCDGDDCKREWFHLPCIGFKNPPKGKWYCDDCLIKMKKVKKI